MITLEFSFDDSHILDQRVATLLEKYGFRGTFYIPSLPMFGTQSMTWREVKNLSARGHILGGHTVNHPMDMKQLNDEKLKFEIEENKTSVDFFINQTGIRPLEIKENPQPVTKFCYPRGRYDERVKQAVKDAGYLEARTTKVGCTDFPTDPFETETTLHLFPHRKEYDADLMTMFNRYLALALEKKDSYFHIWGHGWEIQEHNLWDVFEQMLQILAKKRDENLCTCK